MFERQKLIKLISKASGPVDDKSRESAVKLCEVVGKMGRDVHVKVIEAFRGSDARASLDLLPLFHGQAWVEDGIKKDLAQVYSEKAAQHPDVVVAALDCGKDLALNVEAARAQRMPDAVPGLKKVIEGAEDDELTELALESLAQVHSGASLAALGDFLSGKHRDMAVSALSKLGTPDAFEKLDPILGENPSNDRVILEAYQSVADDRCCDRLIELMCSRSTGVRNRARDCVTAIGPAKMHDRLGIAVRDWTEPDDLVQALNAISDMNDTDGVEIVAKLLDDERCTDPNVRYAAYECIGNIANEHSSVSLVQGLADEVRDVRTAAARALEASFTEIDHSTVAELYEKFRWVFERSEQQRSIVDSLIDGRAHRLFRGVLDWDAFRDVAMQAVVVHPDVETRQLFVAALEDAGFKIDASVTAVQPVEEGNEKIVYLIDDQPLMHAIYRRCLGGSGAKLVTFTKPGDALDAIRKKRPHLIITDLNMPGVTGLDLVTQAREVHPSQAEVPIIMITSQMRLDLKNSMRDLGYFMMVKPVQEKPLKKFVERFLDQAVKARKSVAQKS